MHDLGSVLRNLCEVLHRGRPVDKWEGPLLKRSEILARSPNTDRCFTEHWLEASRDQGYDLEDIVLLVAYQFGFENGLIHSEAQRKSLDKITRLIPRMPFNELPL